MLVAEGISVLGTRMSTVALPWLVLTSTGSATRTGLVAFAEMLPYVLVLAVGGPVIDRLGARRMSLACDVLAAIAVALIPLAYAAGMLQFGVLLALIAAVGTARGFADSSKRLLVPPLIEVSGTPIERATGLHDGVSRAASLIGAPLAGALVGLFGAPAVLAVDAVTFAAAAVILAVTVPAIPAVASAASHAAAGGRRFLAGLRQYTAEVGEGLAWLRQHRLMCGIAAMVCVTNLLDAGYATVLVPLWANKVAGDPLALGLVFGGMAGGAVLGNVLAAWAGPRLPRYSTYAWGFLLCGAPRFFALMLLENVPLTVAIVFVCGLGSGVLNPILGAVEYEAVPRELQARVLGAIGALAWAGIPVGGLLAGWVAGGPGLATALGIAGGGYFLATLAPFVFPSWREMDREADREPAEVPG
jgi:MFS family permease